jgi:hypothetical protein
MIKTFQIKFKNTTKNSKNQIKQMQKLLDFEGQSLVKSLFYGVLILNIFLSNFLIKFWNNLIK